MIRPPPACFMAGTTARQHSQTPSTFVSLNLLKLFVSQLVDRPADVDPRVIDQDLDATHRRDRPIDHRLNVLGTSHIGVASQCT